MLSSIGCLKPSSPYRCLELFHNSQCSQSLKVLRKGSKLFCFSHQLVAQIWFYIGSCIGLNIHISNNVTKIMQGVVFWAKNWSLISYLAYTLKSLKDPGKWFKNLRVITGKYVTFLYSFERNLKSSFIFAVYDPCLSTPSKLCLAFGNRICFSRLLLLFFATFNDLLDSIGLILVLITCNKRMWLLLD